MLLIAFMLMTTSMAMSNKNPIEDNDTNTITVSGQVIDSDTDTPISDALVRAAAPHIDMRQIRVNQSEKVFEISTDENGYFDIKLPVGDAEFMSMDVLAEGYRTVAGTFRSGGDPQYSMISLKHMPKLHIISRCGRRTFNN